VISENRDRWEGQSFLSKDGGDQSISTGERR
jgi:hypothetical protein